MATEREIREVEQVINTKAGKQVSIPIVDIDPEQLLTDAYYGTGGFQDGTYLVAHKRETVEKYNARRNVSYYLNYLSAVVNSHVDPIFRKEAERDWGQNTLFGEFTQDVDMNGTKLSGFVKQAAITSKLLGVSFIAVDNFPDQPVSLADVIKDRKYPYAYILEPSRIKKWKTNRFGQLTSITYTIPEEETESDNEPKWNLITWTKTDWKIESANGEVKSTDAHNLGRIPVVALFSRQVKPGQYKVVSEFYSIARTCLRIFNLCSELDEILRNQAFSILTYPGGANNKANDITVGVENVLGYSPDSSTAPAFIAPSADPANMIMAQIDRLIQEIYRMAGISHVTGVEKQQSGVSKQYDFQKQNENLSDFANNCERCEREIADIFKKWTGQNFEYNVDYGDDFGIADINAELEKAITALEIAIGGEFNKEVKLSVARAYFANLDDERLQEILDDIEAQHEDEMESEEQNKDLENQNGELDLEIKKQQAKQYAKCLAPVPKAGAPNNNKK
jgi:hypothetical protein